MYDPFEVINHLQVTDDPIFIVGPHKSGTSLLRSLFDGHEDLFVLPIEMHFLVHAGFYVEYAYQSSSYDPSKLTNFYSNILQWVKKSEGSNDVHSDSITQGKWDLQLLGELLERAPKTDANLKEMLDYTIKAIYLALRPIEIKNKLRFVEKSVENAELVPIYKKLYTNAEFVHIVRNPYSNFLSFRKYKTYNGKYPYVKPIISSLQTHYGNLYKNRNYLDKFTLIKYEELINDPVATMQGLSHDLHVQYSEVLLSPTSVGEDWNGNSISGRNFSGISAENIDAWKGEINHFEISIINKFLTSVLANFNYAKIEPNRHWTWKSREESVKIYFDNRIYFLGA